MYLNYTECRKRFGSPYQIEKAVADGYIKKIAPGVYSDGGRKSWGQTPRDAYFSGGWRLRRGRSGAGSAEMIFEMNIF